MMKKLFSDLFTGPDGRTVAIGRVYSAPVLVSALATPFVMMWKGQPVDLAALGVMYGGAGAACLALITGTNTTEPKADQS